MKFGYALLFTLSITFSLSAGTVYELSCSNSKCGFKERIIFGGREQIHQIFGYCYKCKKSTNWEWRSGFDINIPKPITVFIDPMDGKSKKVYPCIRCNEPFVQITDPRTIKQCPECLEISLSCTNKGIIID